MTLVGLDAWRGRGLLDSGKALSSREINVRT